MKRINIAIADDLLERVDKAAKALSISRSAFISISVTQKMQQDSVLQDLPRLLTAYDEVKRQEQKKSKK